METAQLHRLKVRVGDAEFDGTGAEELLNSQFDRFLNALERISAVQPQGRPAHPTAPKNASSEIKSEPNNNSIEQHTWERFYLREEGDNVSLKILPKTDNVQSDTLMLLLYGYLHLCNVDTV